MPAPLAGEELAALAGSLPAWQVSPDHLTREVRAPDFLTGIDWVLSVARAAEEAGHHPDIDIRWRTVRFTLTTHDAGGSVTHADAALAAVIDSIVEQPKERP